MTYLTVKEAAELAGCSERTVRRKIESGDIISENEYRDSKNYSFKIPVDKLPEDIRRRYYKRLKAEGGVPKASGRRLEEYSEKEREQIRMWTELLERWQRERSNYDGNKADADARFVSRIRLEKGPGFPISVETLYRKQKAYKSGDLDALTDRRGGSNRGKSSINEEVWSYFLSIYLDERRPPLSTCHAAAREYALENKLCDAEGFPSRTCFSRRLEREVPKAVLILGREGEKACLDKAVPYINRDYGDLRSNDIWIADNHTLDFITRYDGSERTHRLHITAFTDARSGVLTGWNLTDNPCSQSTILALRHAIRRFGIPKKVYFDNGSEFLTHDIAGRGHRRRKSQGEPLVENPVFKRLGIELINAQVKNAKAKNIERFFGTLKNDFSRCMSTFCGGNVLEKPESLKKILKGGGIPTDSDAAAALAEWADGIYNVGAYGGKAARDRGKPRIEVWNERIDEKRQPVNESELNLMLMRTTKPQRVGRNGVYLSICGERLEYWDSKTYMLEGKSVYIRYDPDDLREVRLYEADSDRFICTLPMSRETAISFDADREDTAVAIGRVREVHRAVKRDLNAFKSRLPAEKRIDLIDMQIRRAHRQKGEFKIKDPKVIIPVRSGEDTGELRAASGGTGEVIKLDIEMMNRNAAKRLKK